MDFECNINDTIFLIQIHFVKKLLSIFKYAGRSLGHLLCTIALLTLVIVNASEVLLPTGSDSCA